MDARRVTGSSRHVPNHFQLPFIKLILLNRSFEGIDPMAGRVDHHKIIIKAQVTARPCRLAAEKISIRQK